MRNKEMKGMLTIILFAVGFGCIAPAGSSSAATVCEIKQHRLTCQYDIPKKIPPGITEVYVKNHKTISLNPNSFGDPSWKNALELQIYQNKEKTNSIHVNDDAFRGLDNLNILGIHTRGFTTYDIEGKNLFRGLENITELDFSGCSGLTSEFLTSSLMQDGDFSKLRSLNLNEVGTDIENRHIDISQSFTSMLIDKGIEKLYLRKTMIFIRSFKQTKSSNISHLDISDTSGSLLTRPDRISIPLLSFFKNLKSLNISQMFPLYWRGQNLHMSNFHLSNCLTITDLFVMNLFYIEDLYANKILPDVTVPAIITNSTFNLTCRMDMRVFEFRGNSLRRFDASVHWPDENFLRHMDLTDNGMSYLSPNASKGLYNLKTLLLGENRLSEMAMSPEFTDLFANCKNLEKLVLDKNGFSILPQSTFLQNKMLNYLSLKGNLLKQVTFQIKHLEKLKYFDLSDNLIHILDEQSMNHLDNLIVLQTDFNLHLGGNPVECSCKSLSFVEWMNTQLVKKLGTTVICTLDKENVKINDNTVSETRFHCIRTAVYVSVFLAALLVAGLIAGLFITVKKMIKRRRKTDQVKKYLNGLRNNQVDEKFICLLSYSNRDSDVVTNHIYKHLNETLKLITGLEGDTVCIDERHFRAGAEIVTEIMRCVSESCVTVFVVSRSFCQSDWCCLEIREAYEQQKPIVLVFGEEVDENEMPMHLKEMFQRYTRAKLVQQDEEIDVQPGGWKGLCDSIILLASRQYAEKKMQNKYQALLDRV